MYYMFGHMSKSDKLHAEYRKVFQKIIIFYRHAFQFKTNYIVNDIII